MKRKKNYISIVIIVLLLLTQIGQLVSGDNVPTDSSRVSDNKVELITEKLRLFGGADSIRVVYGDLSAGVLYSSSENRKIPPIIFIRSSPIISIAIIRNTQGTIIYRFPIKIENTFALILRGIAEFPDFNNDSLINLLKGEKAIRAVNLSNTSFKINIDNKTKGESFLYQIVFSGTDIPYLFTKTPNPWVNDSDKLLDNLTFTFDLSLKLEEDYIQRIPITEFSREDDDIKIEQHFITQNIKATSLETGIKFSCDFEGWDYVTPVSKLVLDLELIVVEQNITPIPQKIRNFINNQTLQRLNLLSKLEFSTQRGYYKVAGLVSKESNFTTNTEILSNNRITVANSLKKFLNFTWVKDIYIDNVKKEITFQPFFAGKNDNLPSDSFLEERLLTSISLRGGIIFPQGNHISYDPNINHYIIIPEKMFIPPPPNRDTLPTNSTLIIIFGTLLLIVAPIIRKKYF